MVRQQAAEEPLGHSLGPEQHCGTSLLVHKVDFLASIETCWQTAADGLSDFASIGRGKAGRARFTQTPPAETWSPPGTKVPSQGGKCWLFWLLSFSWQSNYLLNCDPVSKASSRRLLDGHHVRMF